MLCQWGGVSGSLLGINYQEGCDYWIRQWSETKLSLPHDHSGGSVKLPPKPNFFEGEAYDYWLRKLEKHPELQRGEKLITFELLSELRHAATKTIKADLLKLIIGAYSIKLLFC